MKVLIAIDQSGVRVDSTTSRSLTDSLLLARLLADLAPDLESLNKTVRARWPSTSRRGRHPFAVVDGGKQDNVQ